jgi:hypothetical protein
MPKFDAKYYGLEALDDLPSSHPFPPAPERTGDGLTPDDLERAAVKYDADKPRWELLQWAAIEEVAIIATKGAEKYDDHNWRKGFRWMRPISAAMRHIYAFIRGEDRDPESGCLHIAHAAWNLLSLAEFQLLGLGTDDRWKKP